MRQTERLQEETFELDDVFIFFLVVSNALILDEIFSPSKRVSPLCFVYSSDEPLTSLLLFIIIVCFKVVFVSFKS